MKRESTSVALRRAKRERKREKVERNLKPQRIDCSSSAVSSRSLQSDLRHLAQLISPDGLYGAIMGECRTPSEGNQRVRLGKGLGVEATEP
jgi:hypothetical protein